MKTITNMSLLKKVLIITIVIITLFNFTCPTIVFADDDDEDESDMGGVLFTPIQALVLGLGDVCMWILNKSTDYDGPTKVTLSKGWVAEFQDWIDGNSGLAKVLRIATYREPVNAIMNAIIEPEPDWPASIIIPFYAVTPDKIFSNRVPLFNVNIMNPPENSPAYEIQGTISKWYNALKNFAIVGLLIVLVYIAIRIIISSAATDKSKYKQMFMDWIVAFCLIFFMHYIMSFSITIVEAITNSLVSTNGQVSIRIPTDQYDEYSADDYEKELANILLELDENGEPRVVDGCYSISMDYTSYIRYRVQVTGSRGAGKAGIAQSGWEKMGFTIMYAVLVIYTVMFSIGYLKRFVYLIYLTLISPLVALTYPIDKIKDGRAQGFNTWLKEYLYNLIIQPVHLILYTVLIGTAMDLSTKYFLYPLIVLGFLLQAEKIIRKLFGFENSSTASAIASGALGGALVMQGINSLSKINKSKSGKESSEENTKIRYNDRKPDDPEGINNVLRTTNRNRNANTQNPNRRNINGQNPNGGNANTQNTNGRNTSGTNTNTQNPNGENSNERMERSTQEIWNAYEDAGGSVNDNGEYYDIANHRYDPNYNPYEDEEYMYNPRQNIFGNEFDEQQDNMQGDYQYDNGEQQVNVRAYNDDGYDNTSVVYRNPWSENDSLDNNSESNISDSIVKNSNNGDSSKSKFFSGVKEVTKTYVKPKNIGKGILKGAARAYGAGVLGTIGVAAGLASDDFGNVAKYGIGAGVVGAMGGKKIANLPSKAYKKASEVKDVYQQGAYNKDEYRRIQNEKSDKAFMKDEKVIEQYRKAFKGKKNGEEAYKVAMKKAMQYRKQGITDNDVIIKAMKANVAGINDDWDDDRRIVAAKLATQGDVNNEKGIQDIKNRLVAKNVQENDAENYVQLIREIKDLF